MLVDCLVAMSFQSTARMPEYVVFRTARLGTTGEQAASLSKRTESLGCGHHLLAYVV